MNFRFFFFFWDHWGNQPNRPASPEKYAAAKGEGILSAGSSPKLVFVSYEYDVSNGVRTSFHSMEQANVTRPHRKLLYPTFSYYNTL